MSEDIVGSEFFWSTIAEAKGSRERLREILSTFSEDEIAWFHEEFVDAAAELKDEPFIEYMVSSEDGQEVVAEWVVSQGRDYYKSVLENPSSIPHEVDEGNETILSGVASAVYRERFGKEFDIY